MEGVRMFTEILLEVIIAVGRLFLNPLLYVAIGLAVCLGYMRVKKERRSFNTRILWGWSEFHSLWREGLLFALLISMIILLIGLTVTPTFLFLVMALSLLGLVTFFLPSLSPSYLVSIAVIIIWWMHEQQWSYTLLGFTLEGTDIFEGLIVTIPIVVGLLLIAEGLLIRSTTELFASPRQEKTRRGLNGIVYTTKRIWLLPIFFVVPGDAIQIIFPYWPQFTFGSQSFSLVVFPFIIGFSQFARRTLPKYLLPKVGRAVLILGEIVLVVGIVALFQPIIGVAALALALAGRLLIAIAFSMKERNDVYAVAPCSAGAVIAAVLPESPAEKMGLSIGETIRKVNGQSVFNASELYEALQINAAHCRIEVLDHHNEVRLTQHVIYSHDHHRIGLLLAEPRK